MIFNKNEYVKMEGNTFRVIIADEELAVLAPSYRTQDEEGIPFIRTDFTDVGIYANENCFIDSIPKFEKIERL